METKFMHFAGIDVSKHKLDVCLIVNSERTRECTMAVRVSLFTQPTFFEENGRGSLFTLNRSLLACESLLFFGNSIPAFLHLAKNVFIVMGEEE